MDRNAILKSTCRTLGQEFGNVFSSMLINIVLPLIALALPFLPILAIVLGLLNIDPSTCTSTPALSLVLLIDGICALVSAVCLWRNRNVQNKTFVKTATVGLFHFGGLLSNVLLSSYTFSLYGYVNFDQKAAPIEEYCNQTLFTFAVIFAMGYWIIGICCSLCLTWEVKFSYRTTYGAKITQTACLNFDFGSQNLKNKPLERTNKQTVQIIDGDEKIISEGTISDA